MHREAERLLLTAGQSVTRPSLLRAPSSIPSTRLPMTAHGMEVACGVSRGHTPGPWSPPPRREGSALPHLNPAEVPVCFRRTPKGGQQELRPGVVSQAPPDQPALSVPGEGSSVPGRGTSCSSEPQGQLRTRPGSGRQGEGAVVGEVGRCHQPGLTQGEPAGTSGPASSPDSDLPMSPTEPQECAGGRELPSPSFRSPGLLPALAAGTSRGSDTACPGPLLGSATRRSAQACLLAFLNFFVWNAEPMKSSVISQIHYFSPN